MTVIAAFFIHFLHGHAMGTMGILLVEFVEYFGCTKGEVAMIGAIQASLFTLGGMSSKIVFGIQHIFYFSLGP